MVVALGDTGVKAVVESQRVNRVCENGDYIVVRKSDRPLLARNSYKSDSPADLRAWERAQLPQLAADAGLLIRVGIKDGGHLARTRSRRARLRCIRIDTPEDGQTIFWCGSRSSNDRQNFDRGAEHMGGCGSAAVCVGFPRRRKRIRHFRHRASSTSIAAALGMAVAARSRDHRASIAVIGDGR